MREICKEIQNDGDTLLRHSVLSESTLHTDMIAISLERCQRELPHTSFRHLLSAAIARLLLTMPPSLDQSPESGELVFSRATCRFSIHRHFVIPDVALSM